MALRNGLSVAVIGATGAVGREIISVLAERQFPAREIKAFASERSVGALVEYKDEELSVGLLTESSFAGVDIALFSAGSAVSKQYAPAAVRHGAVVIDNSSAWRLDPNTPLIVPEVNSSVLRSALSHQGVGKGIIVANPNCSTIELCVVLKPLQERFGIKRCVVSTYQSTSGAGQRGMDELWNQTRDIFSQEDTAPSVFPQQIAFNCIPQVGELLDSGYSGEEMKIINESKKILGLPDLKITATAVRVPVFACHSESVNVEFESSYSLEEVRALLQESPGVYLFDDPEKGEYPTNIDVAGQDACFVGRLRRDDSVQNGLNMWLVADNVRKGAALNAVEIAEIVVDQMAE